MIRFSIVLERATMKPKLNLRQKLWKWLGPPHPGADLGGGCRGCAPPPQKKTRWFIGVEVEQETSAPPPKKNPGSAPVTCYSLKGERLEYERFRFDSDLRSYFFLRGPLSITDKKL